MPGKGIDPVKRARLQAILTDTAHNAAHTGTMGGSGAARETAAVPGAPSAQAEYAAHAAQANEVRLIHDWHEEWILQFPDALSRALAHLPPEALALCAAAWAATAEWHRDGADSPTGREALRHWLRDVGQLAQRGACEGRSLYLWMSL